MDKSSKSKANRDEGSKDTPQSKALANLMNYENEDSESANEDSNDASTSQLQPSFGLAAMQPRSILGKSPVKFAVKKRFDKIQAFGIKPKLGGQGTIRVASKWDDPDDGENNASGIKKLQLYGSASSREGSPDVDDRGVIKKFNAISPLVSSEVSSTG